jgi:tetraacyldisaccharide 4'-kinase
MNFNFPLLKPLRILLFPFSFLYILGVAIRNFLYDKNILRSTGFNLPVICVGNLAVGGTGKSPMVEYLLRTLINTHHLATVSRGYKRKTKGYALAGEGATALEIGDEPMQFHLKFPGVAVAVGEERLVAIPQLLHDRPATDVIILDDAFQHRSVKAGLNIVLTDCNNLYPGDWYMPTGDLRDEKRSAARADIMVVTKCPANFTETQKNKTVEQLALLPHQQLYFSTVKYGAPYHITQQTVYNITDEIEVLLVSGIANPAPLKKYLANNSKAYYEVAYNDHHIFTIDDLNYIKKRFEEVQAAHKIILTTEKDAVRLNKFNSELTGLPLYVMPIEIAFLFNGQHAFNQSIFNFINRYSQ